MKMSNVFFWTMHVLIVATAAVLWFVRLTDGTLR